MTPPNAFRNWLVALAACAVVVGLIMAYVDIPIADYSHAHIRFSTFSVVVVRVLEGLSAGIVLVLAIQAGAGIWAMRGQSPAAWAQTPLLCGWSAVWALATATVLKRLIGRAQVYPTYVIQHSTGYHWFLASPEYQAFPSGTTSVAGAVLAVIWIRAPRYRPLAAVTLVLIAAGLTLTNSHWLSDTIAGAFLGCTIGWMTVLLLDRRHPA